MSKQGATYIWIAVLAVYVFAASVVPVQWLLQPRDYLNSYLLVVSRGYDYQGNRLKPTITVWLILTAMRINLSVNGESAPS